MSGEIALSALGQAVVWIAPSNRARGTLIDLVPVNSRLSAVRLNGSVHVDQQRNR